MITPFGFNQSLPSSPQEPPSLPPHDGPNVPGPGGTGLPISDRVSALLLKYLNHELDAKEREELLLTFELFLGAHNANRELVNAASFLHTEADRLGTSLALVRTLTALEERLHRLRILPSRSNEEDFADLCGLNSQVIHHLLRALPERARNHEQSNVSNHEHAHFTAHQELLAFASKWPSDESLDALVSTVAHSLLPEMSLKPSSSHTWRRAA